MIFNKNTTYATVWNVTPAENGKYIDLQITTSEKDENGEYKNSGWFPRVIGNAVKSLRDVKPKDRIVITQSKFTNERKDDGTGKKKSYFKFLILEAHIDGKENSSTAPALTPVSDEEDPF